MGFAGILHGIVDISQATHAYQKYGHLLHALEDHDCLRLPEELDGHLWPKVRPGLGKQLRQVEVTVGDGEFGIEVIYVQPTGGEGAQRVIDFHESVAHGEEYDDPVSEMFAQSLRKWVGIAGKADPVTAGERSAERTGGTTGRQHVELHDRSFPALDGTSRQRCHLWAQRPAPVRLLSFRSGIALRDGR